MARLTGWSFVMIFSAASIDRACSFQVVALFPGDAPACERIAVRFFQALLLRPLVEVHPVLRIDAPSSGVRVEDGDLVEPGAELGAPHAAVDAMEAADADARRSEKPMAPCRRQVAPEAPCPAARAPDPGGP